MPVVNAPKMMRNHTKKEKKSMNIIYSTIFLPIKPIFIFIPIFTLKKKVNN